MSGEDLKKLSLTEGRDAAMGLIDDLVRSSAKQDTQGVENILGGLDGFVKATGIEEPRIHDDLTALSGKVREIQFCNDIIETAMLAGGYERVKALSEAGIPLDYHNIPGVNVPMGDGFTNDDADTEDLTENEPQFIELLTEFAQNQDGPAQTQIDEADPWTKGHAEALSRSCKILSKALSR